MGTGVENLCVSEGASCIGFRSPSVAEMQVADKEVWQVIGDLTSKGWSLNDALHEVVEVRCLLHSELQSGAVLPSCSEATRF